jgi:hypothetical protein
MSDAPSAPKKSPPTGDQRRPNVERYVVPAHDYEKQSYKPPTGPVDQVKPKPPSPPAQPKEDGK